MAKYNLVKPEHLNLKNHPELGEQWVQQCIADDPAILGLGPLVLKDKERRQPRAGRLDLLLQDADTDRRYEVEVQLGRTDESHIIRTIEYWDIERRRYRMIHAMLGADGFEIGRDRVYRLWRTHGYGVKRKPVKKRRLGISENGIMRQKSESINDVWCWDFIHDRDERGRGLRWLVIEDEFTREGLAVDVRRSFKAKDVLDVVSELMLIRGVPKHIRSDNGPELIAQAIQTFLAQTGVGTLYIEPGAPWQNAYAESFNSRFRAELLSQESFAGLAEAKQVSGWWQNHYNHRRPHSSLDYQPPARFAASLGMPPLQREAAPLACATAPPAIESAITQPTLIQAGT